MSTVPTTEPNTLRVGDLWTWLKSLAEYPANAGWTLAYTLINANKKITITASASGADHLISVAAATTAGYTAGFYSWMARITKGLESYTIDEGTIEVLPDLAAVSTYDGRSHAQTMVEAIEAAIEGRASALQLKMEINGRSIEYMGAGDLIKWLSFYRTELAKEGRAETLRRTGINRNKIGVRCVRV